VQSIGTTEWLVNRQVSRGFVYQSSAVFNQQGTVRELVVPAVNWLGLVPSWVVFATILLATTAICGTVILRARAELRASSNQRQMVESEIQSLRLGNEGLRMDIQRLSGDPSAIEFAARERLGMVKATDIVVTMDSITPLEKVASGSLVH
jgi:cell division protein FtsB